MAKTALITGVTGQDGAYLAEFLIGKGYQVHGIKRRTSLFNTDRVDHLFHEAHEGGLPFTLHHGDMTDSSSLLRVIGEVRPDEVYNLAAQSHVQVSFEEPEYTANADAIGTLRLLEAIRILGLGETTRFYQASTSELYGKVVETPAVRVDAVPSALALWRRQALRPLDHGQLPRGLRLLRLQRHPVQSREPDPRRDLRHPQDHPRARPHRARHPGLSLSRQPQRQARLGPQPRLCRGAMADAPAGAAAATTSSPPASSTASANSSRSPPRASASASTGRGRGSTRSAPWPASTSGRRKARCKVGQAIVRVDPVYFRPAEVETLLGDATRARHELGWAPKVSFGELVDEMTAADLALARREKASLGRGLKVFRPDLEGG